MTTKVPNMDNRMPLVKHASSGQGVSAQRKGKVSVKNPDVPGLNRTRVNVHHKAGGQGVAAQRMGRVNLDTPGIYDVRKEVDRGSEQLTARAVTSPIPY